MQEGLLFSKSKNIPEAGHSFSFPPSRPLLFLIRPSLTWEQPQTSAAADTEAEAEDGIYYILLISCFQAKCWIIVIDPGCFLPIWCEGISCRLLFFGYFATAKVPIYTQT